MKEINLDIELLPHQLRFVNSNKPFTAMVCGRGAGKTYVASYLAALKILNGERVIIFAQTWDALTQNLMKEIKFRLDEISEQINVKIPYRYIGGKRIEIPNGGVVYGATYENQDKVRGFTQISTLILDEVAMSKPDLLQVVMPCMRALPDGLKPHTYAMTTPKAGSWFNLYVMDKLKEKPDYIDLIQAKSIDNFKQTEEEYANYAEGFTDENLIKQELEGELLNLQALNSVIAGVPYKLGNLPMPEKGRVIIGIDGSGWGKDQTVITYRIDKAFYQKCYGILSGPDCRNEIKMELMKHKGWHVGEINIDAAYGEKYFENLTNEFESVELINFGGKSTDDKYANKRCEMYFDLVKKLREGMPITDEIEQELTFTLFEFNNNGKLKLIPKDDIKLVLKHSPDKTDSLALTFAHGVKDYGEIYETGEDWLGNPED